MFVWLEAMGEGLGGVDLLVLAMLVLLAFCLGMIGFSHLAEGDRQESAQNRWEACRWHHWARTEKGLLMCALCTKIPG